MDSIGTLQSIAASVCQLNASVDRQIMLHYFITIQASVESEKMAKVALTIPFLRLTLSYL